MVVQRIVHLMKKYGYKWQRQGKWFQPTESDVSAVLADARKVLFNAPDDTEFQQATILVRKEQDQLNVYLHIGEIK